MLARSRRTLAPVMPPQGAAPRLVSSPFPELCTSWSLPQRNCASAHESLPCLGMRLANVYDINAKARWLAGGGGLG